MNTRSLWGSAGVMVLTAQLLFGATYEHTVTFTVKELPTGQAFYMGQLLIVGKPLP